MARRPTLSTSDDPDQDVALRQQLQARRTRELAELLDERTDLRGVNALADLVSDQVAWCA